MDDLCKATYVLYLQVFGWWKMPQAVHGFLAHSAQRIEQNDGVSIGELSEQGIEQSNKELRQGREKFARKVSLEMNYWDVYKRQYIKSDKVLWEMKREPKCKECYDTGHTSRKCPMRDKDKKKEEELDEDEILFQTLLLD